MSEWKEYSIGEVADVIGGGTPSTKNENYWNGEIPWLTPRDLSNFNHRYISHGERNISLEGLKNSSARLLPKNTVLLSSRAPIGYLAISINELTTNQGFRSLVPTDKTNSLFLYYLLKNNVDYLISQGSGSTFGELSGSVLKDIKFSFPPLSEQKAIASILSSLDDKIELLQKQNETLEKIALTVFINWYNSLITNGQSKKRISDIIEVKDGTHDSPKPKEVGKFLITSRHLKNNSIDFRNAYYISNEEFVQINKRSLVEKNDILFSMIGTIGLLYYVNDDVIDYAIKNIGLFKTSQKPSFAKFFYLLLKSPFGQQFIFENIEGSTQEYIPLNSLRGFEINYPGDMRINEFDKILCPFFEKQKNNSDEIRKLTKLRDSLLPKLMTGEVRVKF